MGKYRNILFFRTKTCEQADIRVREGGMRDMRAGGIQFKRVVPSNNTNLSGTNVRISRAQQRCKNNMKVIPANADRIEKKRKVQ